MESKKLITELAETLDETKRSLFEALEAQKEELAESSATSAKTAKAIDDANARLTQLHEDLKDAQEKYAGDLASMQERVDEVETEFKRLNVPGPQRREPAGPTAGQRFIESDAYKEFARKAAGGNIPRESETFIVERLTKAGELATTEATRLVEPMRAALVSPPERGLRIRDLIPSVATTQNSIEYLEETGFHNMTTTALTSAITETGNIATVTTAAAHNLIEGDSVRIAGTTPAEFSGDWTVLEVPSSTTFTFDVGATVADTTVHGTWMLLNQGKAAAAAVAELAAAAQSQLEFTLRTVSMGEIAHWIAASRQVLADAGFLQSYIDGKLAYGLDYAEDEDLLYGSGVAPAIEGILSNGRRLTYSWSEGEVGPPADTKIDALRRAMTIAYRREYMPTAIVINPLDREDLDLAKDSTGRYLWASVSAGTENRIWRLPVVESNAIAAGTALTGSFALGATIYDRQQTEIRIAEQHSDFFTKRINVILATKRMVPVWSRPDAFVEVTFDAVPT